MKAYVTTTGTIFALVTLAHIWRMVEERQLAKTPWYIAITAAAAALSVWAWSVRKRA